MQRNMGGGGVIAAVGAVLLLVGVLGANYAKGMDEPPVPEVTIIIVRASVGDYDRGGVPDDVAVSLVVSGPPEFGLELQTSLTWEFGIPIIDQVSVAVPAVGSGPLTIYLFDQAPHPGWYSLTISMESENGSLVLAGSFAFDPVGGSIGPS